MLYRFKSQATAELTLLEAPAKLILQAIGKNVTPQGVILPEDVPAAIAALERAVEADSLRRAARSGEDEEDDGGDDAPSDAPARGGVTLRQRAAPFIQMLREAAAAGERVTWGV